jgi:type I restriction enzyme R subunit
VFRQTSEIVVSPGCYSRRRKAFAVYENTITSLFEACKPEIIGNPIVRSVAVFQYLRGVVDAIIEQKDIDAVSGVD